MPCKGCGGSTPKATGEEPQQHLSQAELQERAALVQRLVAMSDEERETYFADQERQRLEDREAEAAGGGGTR